MLNLIWLLVRLVTIAAYISIFSMVHVVPRLSGGIMMDGSMMGGMVPHGDCGPDHHGMPVNGPMCDEYGRGRNVSIEIQIKVFFTHVFHQAR